MEPHQQLQEQKRQWLHRRAGELGYGHHHSMDNAIRREKHLKKWKRDWKIRIIEEMNPNWLDLHDKIDAIATPVPTKAGPLPSQG